jgi:hypothetical protein
VTGRGKRAATGISVGEAGARRGEAEKMAEFLLLRLVPEAARGEVGNAGNGRMPWRLSPGETAPSSLNENEREQMRMSGGFRWAV